MFTSYTTTTPYVSLDKQEAAEHQRQVRSGEARRRRMERAARHGYRSCHARGGSAGPRNRGRDGHAEEHCPRHSPPALSRRQGGLVIRPSYIWEMKAKSAAAASFDVVRTAHLADALERYRMVLNRELDRRGWCRLSDGEIVQAVVERFSGIMLEIRRGHDEPASAARVGERRASGLRPRAPSLPGPGGRTMTLDIETGSAMEAERRT